MDSLTIYAVRSKDGKYLRSTGLKGGEHWVEDITQARLWSNIGPAKSQITFWAKNYPQYGTPQLIPLLVTPQEPVVMDDYVKDTLRKQELAKLNSDRRIYEYRITLAESQLEYSKGKGWEAIKAVEDLEKETKRLNDINRKIKEYKLKN